ncbi:MAG: M48 family metalloprotease [Promethearchaeota archaeon]
MHLAKLRVRMVWATLGVFIVGTLFALAMVYIIDIVFGYLLMDDFFALIWWYTIPFTSFAIPLPYDIMWAFFVGVLMLLFQWLIGPAMVRVAVRMKYVDRRSGGWLYEEVERLSRKADLPMPNVAVVESKVPNAFVFGRTAGGATLAVHTGLINTLNQREISGVLAHELGHIRHKDLIVMTLASAIPLIALMVLRGSLWGGRAAAYSGRGSKNGKGCLVILFALIAIAVLSALVFGLSLLVVRGLSRMREHYADSYSAQLTGDPRALQSALAKITWGLSLAEASKNTGLRSFYIGDSKQAAKEVGYIQTHRHQFDLDKDGVLDERELLIAMETEAKRHRLGGISAALSTHPPTYKRILLLKDLEKEITARQAVVPTREEAQPALDEI